MMQQMAQIALSNLIKKNMSDDELVLNEKEIIKILNDFIGNNFKFELARYIDTEEIYLRIIKND